MAHNKFLEDARETLKTAGFTLLRSGKHHVWGLGSVRCVLPLTVFDGYGRDHYVERRVQHAVEQATQLGLVKAAREREAGGMRPSEVEAAFAHLVQAGDEESGPTNGLPVTTAVVAEEAQAAGAAKEPVEAASPSVTAGGEEQTRVNNRGMSKADAAKIKATFKGSCKTCGRTLTWPPALASHERRCGALKAVAPERKRRVPVAQPEEAPSTKALPNDEDVLQGVRRLVEENKLLRRQAEALQERLSRIEAALRSGQR